MWFWSLRSEPPTKTRDITDSSCNRPIGRVFSLNKPVKEKRTQPLSPWRSWLYVAPPNNQLFNSLETILSPTSCQSRSRPGRTCQWCNQRKCRIRALGSWNVSGALQETDTTQAPCVAWFGLHIFYYMWWKPYGSIRRDRRARSSRL